MVPVESLEEEQPEEELSLEEAMLLVPKRRHRMWRWCPKRSWRSCTPVSTWWPPVLGHGSCVIGSCVHTCHVGRLRMDGAVMGFVAYDCSIASNREDTT